MATNEILQFAETDTGTNLLTQAEYLADSQRPIGNQPGVARSKLVNKALRQASLIAAGLAEYIADNQANNITDALTPQNIADYLQAAITGALGVTPPQFDSDTSLATTAFVQRALGNHQRAIPITSVGNFLDSDVGGAFYIGAAGTYSLPLISAVPEGAKFTFLATVNGVIISRSGSDQLLIGSAGATTLTLNNGDTATFTKIGTFWALLTGTAAGRGSTGDFGKSLGTNGYQKLPSGLIVQWGQTPASDGTGEAQATFPIAFPNNYYVVCNGPATQPNPTIELVNFNLSVVRFRFRTADSTALLFGASCYYIAIGR
jgi:hypothetical protein